MKRIDKLILSFVLFPFVLYAQNLDVKIDWGVETYKLSEKHWSVNDYEVLHPDLVSQDGFISYSRELAPAMIRIHQAQIADAWSDEVLHDWNYERIAASFEAASKAYGNAEIILNPICRWPKWLSASEGLTDSQADKLVEMSRNLALFIKKHPEWNVKYWEILNEGEQYWENNGILEEYWTLFNRIAVEVKSILPEVKVGGPALTWPKPEWLTSFLDVCGENIDFISWHNYGSGSPENLTSDILDKSVIDIENHARFVKEQCRERNLDLEFFLTEYNFQWVWTPFEVRHANNEGAVFQASVLNHLAPLVDGIFVWHLKGHSYGLIDNDNAIRATGQLYLWGKNYLVGSVKKYTVENEAIEMIPVVKEGSKNLLIINKSIESYDVNLSRLGMRSPSVMQINANWKTITEFDGRVIKLYPYSVTLLTE